MTILVADIGATNARFQLGSADRLVGEPVVLETDSFAQAEVMLRQAVRQLGEPDLQGAVLALAGPVYEGVQSVEITNTGLRIERRVAQQALGCEALLINDFVALAHAIPDCGDLVQIGTVEHAPHAQGVKALLGPGTGLGMATLVPIRDAWHVLSSEGGHADLAPGSFLEAELWGILAQSHGQVGWETVLSGAGLTNLYVAICAIWGSKPEELTAATISTRGVRMDDPVCHQTLETFCGLLGAAAGNLALTVGATGGVYICGGIAPRIIDFIQTSPLRRRFEERGDLSDYARRIATWVVVEQAPGLRGAHEYHRQADNGSNTT